MSHDLDLLQQRILELEQRVEMDASIRRLSASAIGSGGLRVHDGGALRIEGTGNLEIVNGNLVLGDGTISGEAFRTQFSSDLHRETGEMQGSTDWKTGVSIDIPQPSWAETTALSISANAATKTPSSLRLGIGGNFTMPVDPVEKRAGFDNAYAIAIVWATTVKAKTTVELQMREFGGVFETNTEGNTLQLAVAAIHYR